MSERWPAWGQQQLRWRWVGPIDARLTALMETRLTPFIRKLGIDLPIFQAPMAGVSTPAMAAVACDCPADDLVACPRNQMEEALSRLT